MDRLPNSPANFFPGTGYAHHTFGLFTLITLSDRPDWARPRHRGRNDYRQRNQRPEDHRTTLDLIAYHL